jgi:5-methyltetrahydrofolate--homocysteine methyltransferase
LSRFLTELDHRLLVFDGAMGTALHALNLPLSDYRGLENCMEILCDSRPDAVQSVHEAYLAAGCDAVETNTFGANQIVLAEFGIAERTRELNRKAAEVARAACRTYATASRPRFVVGSAGPGTKLPTLGHVEPRVLLESYREQGRGLLDGGVDVILVETCQDILQCKIAVQAMLDAMEEAGRKVPLMAQVTMETTGTMLVGTEMPAVIAALSPFPLAALGVNCATGPREMAEHVQVLSGSSPFPISCLPNAGLPELIDGHTHYPLSPEELARWLERFVVESGVRIVGGCCGTTAAHLAAVVKALEGKRPGARAPAFRPSVSSIYRAEPLIQDTSILLVGERTNANGSRQFKKLLEAGDLDGMVRMAREQVAEGSHVLDLCVAYVGRDETKDLDGLVKRLRTDVRVPLMIDSTEPPVMERALELIGGRSILNSVNLEDGEPRCDRVFGLARRHGAAVVALTIDEEGMAKTADRKLAIARRLLEIASSRHGLAARDLLFDPLTFTICTGNEDDRKLGLETLRGIELIHREFPEAGIILGLSNISFGLKPAARHILNSVFLYHAQQAGLTAAIVHAAKIMPLNRIDPVARGVAEDLVFDRRREGYDPLQKLIELTQDVVEEKKADLRTLPVEERLKRRIVEGDRVGLQADLDEALSTRKALSIINDVLLEGMKVVGDLFASGEMQLPFVLQSAETMKAAVAHLEPHMDRVQGESKGRIVLATVRGDVHDIGKNLVDIILTNNGYTVYNLGIKQPLEPILEAFARYEANAIGLSGLLVKSTVVMRENLEEMERRKLQVPVILGGAALNRGYVESDCRKSYGGRVEYAKDAFDGLKLMADICARKDVAAPAPKERRAPREAQAEPRAAAGCATDGAPPLPGPVRRDVPVPVAPFFGVRVFDQIPLKTVAPFMNETALFRVQWQIRQKKMTAAEYEKFLDSEIRPKYFELLADLGRRKLLQPKAVVGFFPCASEGDTLHVFDEGAAAPRESFHFPRQVGRQGLCLADFFRPIGDGVRDVVAFTAVTVGEQASLETARLFREDRYQDYLYVHGISVEMAEALAEYVHLRVRADLGIGADDAPLTADLIKQHYRGRRFSPGYPACPELSDQEKIFRLLNPERIGLRLNEEHQLEPEQSTTALIVHHPQAAYFTI